MKSKVFIFLILLLVACSKSKDPSSPSTPVVNYSTKYSSSQTIVLSRALNNGLHPESLKVLNINNKYYLINSYADLFGLTYDYFRSFEIDTTSGLLTENTQSNLGVYKEVGFPKSPFFYEDLNGDGIKDLFEVDHGKETASLMVDGKFPGFFNHLFLGNSAGKFSSTYVSELTDVKRFHHNAAVGDLDNDGDNDLVIQYFGNEEMIYFKNSNGLKKEMSVTPNNSTGAVLINDIDGDGVTDLISAPYIDRGSIPSTYVLKINLNATSYSYQRISQISPFGSGYGCYKLFAMKNPKNLSKKNIFYLVEAGAGDQKILRSREDDITKIDDITTLQSTYKSNGTRDYLIIDLNFDGADDIFFMVNTGETLNQRIWINKGDNTFENPTWEIDPNLKDYFIPLILNKSEGRVKFIYYGNTSTLPQSKIVDVYTKKRQVI
jgi:hypothetical protein